MFENAENFENRLLDYLFFVAPSKVSEEENVGSKSKVAKRYPPDDVGGSLLPGDVSYFCQPEGTHIETSAGGSAVKKDRRGSRNIFYNGKSVIYKLIKFLFGRMPSFIIL